MNRLTSGKGPFLSPGLTKPRLARYATVPHSEEWLGNDRWLQDLHLVPPQALAVESTRMSNVKLLSRYRQSIVRRHALKICGLGLIAAWFAFPQAALRQHAEQGIGLASNWLRHRAMLALGGSTTPTTAMSAASVPGIERLKAVNGFAAKEIQCLALSVYYEASRDIRDAQIGIARVALNRVAASKSPREICKTVYAGLNTPAGCHFEATCRNIGVLPKLDNTFGQSIDVAMEVASGVATAPQLAKATHFHEGRSRPGWTLSHYKIGRVGKFEFYSTEFPEDAAMAAGAAAAGQPAAEKQAAGPIRSVPRRQSQQQSSAATMDPGLSRRVFGID